MGLSTLIRTCRHRPGSSISANCISYGGMLARFAALSKFCIERCGHEGIYCQCALQRECVWRAFDAISSIGFGPAQIILVGGNFGRRYSLCFILVSTMF